MRKGALTFIQLDTALPPDKVQSLSSCDSKAEDVGIELERDAPWNTPFQLTRRCLQTGKLILDRFQAHLQYRASMTEKAIARANLNVIEMQFCVSGTNEAALFGGNTQMRGPQDMPMIDLECSFMTADKGVMA